MFERALIRRIDGTDVDLGLIAETIFFYGKTHLLLDQPFLIGLSRALSLSDFQRLIKSETVHLSYKTGNFGVVSTAPPKRHKFVEFLSERRTRKNSRFQRILNFFSHENLKTPVMRKPSSV